MKTFLRWVGGKQRNINKFVRFLPSDFHRFIYVEPFLGSGALFFRKKPNQAFLSDINPHLINFYKVVQDHPNELIQELKRHDILDKKKHEKYYLKIRRDYNEWNSKNKYLDNHFDNIKQGSRFLYMNCRCFNGLYRENSNGKFNVGYARDLKGLKNICNEHDILKTSKFLKQHDIIFETVSFEKTLKLARLHFPDQEFFFFIDPPYDAMNDSSSNFTNYCGREWTKEDLHNLEIFTNDINSSGSKFMLCNHATDNIKSRFNQYNQYTHLISRSVSCKVKERKPVHEIVIINYTLNNLDKFLKG